MSPGAGYIRKYHCRWKRTYNDTYKNNSYTSIFLLTEACHGILATQLLHGTVNEDGQIKREVNIDSDRYAPACVPLSVIGSQSVYQSSGHC